MSPCLARATRAPSVLSRASILYLFICFNESLIERVAKRKPSTVIDSVAKSRFSRREPSAVVRIIRAEQPDAFRTDVVRSRDTEKKRERYICPHWCFIYTQRIHVCVCVCVCVCAPPMHRILPSRAHLYRSSGTVDERKLSHRIKLLWFHQELKESNANLLYATRAIYKQYNAATTDIIQIITCEIWAAHLFIHIIY